MQRNKSAEVLFITLIVWSILIFYFSSQPPGISHSQSTTVTKIIHKVNDFFDITDTKIYERMERLATRIYPRIRYRSTNHVVRKSAHFGIYFILGIICSSFGYAYSRKILMGFLLGVSLPVTIAVLDEFNQSFVGRTSSLNDVIIDGSGAFTGTVVVILWIFCIQGAKMWLRRYQRK